MNHETLKTSLDNGTPLTGEEANYLIDLVEHHEEDVKKVREDSKDDVIGVLIGINI